MFKKLIKKLNRWIDKIFEKICYPFSDNDEADEIVTNYEGYDLSTDLSTLKIMKNMQINTYQIKE